jgi:excisionase family DNA binding protein
MEQENPNSLKKTPMMPSAHSGSPPMRTMWKVPEVAAFLDVAEETVREWARKGILPGKKMGKFWLFHPEVIQNLLIENKSNAG